MLKLIIEDDEGKTTIVPLIRDEITIGRREGNTIRLTERNVSRRHARLIKQNGSLYVEDLSSYNGIRLNGVRISGRAPMNEGDQVVIGDYKLGVRVDRPAAAPGTRSAPAMSTELPTNPVLPRVTVEGHGIPGVPTATSGGAAPGPTSTPAYGMPAAVSPHASSAPTPSIPYPAALPVAQPVAAPTPAQPAPQLVSPQAAPPVAQAPVAHAAPASGPVPAPSDGPPRQPMEGAPTMPMRSMAESAGPGAEGVASARLVALTTELAGAEFLLDRPSVVVGRTDENDVVLNHRSISRHHAKIVRDGARYTIVDLQSANGVRVNGEQYERIEVNAGDTIELGHVKLRFVGAHEMFVFDATSIRAGRSGLVKPVVLISGGAALAVAVVAIMMGGPGKPKSKMVDVRPMAQAAPPTPVVHPAEPAAPPGAPGAPPATEETVADLLGRANNSLKGEEWAASMEALDKVLLREPQHPEAKQLRTKAEGELKNASVFARFTQAAQSGELEAAVTAFGEIAEESIYKERAEPAFIEVKNRFVASHLELARKASAAGQCDEAAEQAGLIENLEGGKNKLAEEAVAACKPASGRQVAAAQRPARKERPPVEKPAPRAVVAQPPPPRPPEDAAAGDAQSLVKQARDAWVRGQHSAAIDFAKRALRSRPGLADAYQIIAVASCSLRDGDGATRAYGRLDDRTKQMVKTLCSRNGIEME